MSGVVAYVDSPWSKNDAGEPEKLMVLVDDEADVPEALGRMVAAEAKWRRKACDPVTIRDLLQTYNVRQLVD